VRLQLSEFLPPLPGEPGSPRRRDHPQPSLFQIMDEIEPASLLDMLERTGLEPDPKPRAFHDPAFHAESENQALGIDVPPPLPWR